MSLVIIWKISISSKVSNTTSENNKTTKLRKHQTKYYNNNTKKIPIEGIQQTPGWLETLSKEHSGFTTEETKIESAGPLRSM